MLLTVAGCPLKDTITRDVTARRRRGRRRHRRRAQPGRDDRRAARRAAGDAARRPGPAKEIPFAQPGSLTKVFAIASGKGGVGKSSVTVNLALAMAGQGLKVGIVDADIYGHSVPAMLGIADAAPDPGRGHDHAGADRRRASR